MANPRHSVRDYTRRTILSRVGRLTPKWARQLALEVSEDLGEDFGERRMYRWLDRLIGEGLVLRTAFGYLLAPASSMPARRAA